MIAIFKTLHFTDLFESASDNKMNDYIMVGIIFIRYNYFSMLIRRSELL